MTRTLRNPPQLAPVAAYEVAPHRYLFTDPNFDPDAPIPYTWREVRDAAPYKVGEVVYVVYGDGFRKALIHHVDADKDVYDFWREVYTVLPETKKGQWSKVFYKAYSGFIQRGYQRAGLAPDVPVKWSGGDSA